MIGHDPADSRVVCPICHKLETLKYQDFLCESCIHNNIEIIRNSVISNELITSSLRQEINRIFDACGHSLDVSNTESEVENHLTESKVNTKVQAPLNATPTAVKSLSLQLRRLDVYNAKRKIMAIDHSKDALQGKVADLEGKLRMLERSMDKRELALTYKKHKLVEQYETELARKRLEVTMLRSESTLQIMHQSTILQKSHYTVIRNLIFTNFKRTRNFGPRLLKPPLLLFNQPVLRFSSFLANNSRVDTINSFIENLITILILFKELFFDERPELFPYLSYLESLLPDESFYTSVQEKIAALRDEVNEQKIDEKDHELNQKDVPYLDRQASDLYLDKVVIKNNAIRIPISSRTVNINRRASVKEVVANTKGGAEATSPNSILSPELPDKKVANGLYGKKIVIVPHRVLTRPFTKLKTKEYLRFVLILVKILLTFNAFLSEINAIMPLTKLKHSRSMMDTLNNLRANSKSNAEGSEEFLYDIETILCQIANLDDHFKSEEALRADSQRGSQKNSSNPSFADLSLILTVTTNSSINTSLVNIQNSEVPSKRRSSNMFRFYSALINRSRRPKQSDETSSVLKIANDDTNIYGMISETNSSETSRLSLQPSARINALKTDKKGTQDVKSIMKVVHSIICDGENSEAPSDLSTQISRTETLCMLAESKAQLDDWDMVSHMY